MTRKFKKLTMGVALGALVATPVMAEKANQLVDINGMRGSSAEGALQQRGFAHVSTHKNSMGYVYSYWWDERDDNCVQVEVYNVGLRRSAMQLTRIVAITREAQVRP